MKGGKEVRTASVYNIGYCIYRKIIKSSGIDNGWAMYTENELACLIGYPVS